MTANIPCEPRRHQTTVRQGRPTHVIWIRLEAAGELAQLHSALFYFPLDLILINSNSSNLLKFVGIKKSIKI
jgi:hypothetical protein